MTIVGNTVKVMSQVGYANSAPNRIGVPQGEFETSEVFIYNGNIYPIYKQMIYVPSMPNNTTANIPHYITDYPTDTGLFVVPTGVILEPGGQYRNIDAYLSGQVDYKVDSSNLIITTTVNMSTYIGIFTLTYVKQNGFTSQVNF